MRIILWLMSLTLAGVASAQSAYEMKGVVLMQPEYVLQERITANDLVPYVGSLNAVAVEVFAANKLVPTGGFMVIAIKPGKRSAVWMDVKPELPPSLSRALIARLRAVAAPDVARGPVVFALKTSIWGGAPPAQAMPSPREWTEAAQKAAVPLEVDDVVERIWPR